MIMMVPSGLKICEYMNNLESVLPTLIHAGDHIETLWGCLSEKRLQDQAEVSNHYHFICLNLLIKL